MKVSVNGEPMEVPDGTTAASLVELLGYDPKRVAVEVDGKICPRASRESFVLSEGQRIELVGFVGGG